MSTLREFLLAGDTSGWGSIPDLCPTVNADDHFEQDVESSSRDSNPLVWTGQVPAATAGDGPQAWDSPQLSLASLLRHGDAGSALEDDAATKLLLFAVLQQLLRRQRLSCRPEAVAITPYLWPLPPFASCSEAGDQQLGNGSQSSRSPSTPSSPTAPSPAPAPCSPALDASASLSRPHPKGPDVGIPDGNPSFRFQDSWIPPGICPLDLPSLTAHWAAGHLSNWGYLMALNRLAGRSYGDPSRSPLLPWVIDMSVDPEAVEGSQGHMGAGPPPGWRDLRRSKWRLTKGEEQLDHTWASSPLPHHLPEDPLSEHTVCMYKARRLPEEQLTAVVRGRFVTQEYPASLERLYQVTPEECIPEFFCDPQIFASRHPQMPDLATPPWARSPAEFVAKHRAALESDYVSSHLHHWIDLTFGYQLAGPAAEAAKNMPLVPRWRLDGSRGRGGGHVQLFQGPHPPQQVAAAGQRARQDVPGPPLGLADCLAELEALEQGAGCFPDLPRPQQPPQQPTPPSVCGHSSVRGADEVAGGSCGAQHALPAVEVQYGQLVVQLYLRRAVHLCPLDLRAWRALLPQLPPSARRLVGACFSQRLHLPDVAVLDFFPCAVRAAHAFLDDVLQTRPGTAGIAGARGMLVAQGHRPEGWRHVGDVCRDDTSARCQLDRLLRSCCREAGQKLQDVAGIPGALQLCLPAMVCMLGECLCLEGEVPAQRSPQQPAQRLEEGGDPQHDKPAPLLSTPADQQAAQRVEEVLLRLLGAMPGTLCCKSFLPAVASWLGGSGELGGICRESAAQRLLHPRVLEALIQVGGLAGFMEAVHRVLLRYLLVAHPDAGGAAGGGRSLEGAVIGALGCITKQVPPPLSFECTIRPLLRALPSRPAAAAALVEVAAALPPHLAGSYVLGQLVQGFDPGAEGAGGAGRLPPSALLNALSALEGVTPLLPAALSWHHIILPSSSPMQDDVAPAPLLAVLLRPDLLQQAQQGAGGGRGVRWSPSQTHTLLSRLAVLVAQVGQAQGAEPFFLHLLPQLVPILTCPDPHRLAYGMDAPTTRPTPTPPPTDPPGPAVLRDLPTHPLCHPPIPASPPAPPGKPDSTPPEGGQAGAARGSSSWREAGGEEGVEGSDSGYWSLVSILYPPCLEVAGAAALRSLVPNWAVIELNLQVRYEWSAGGAPPSFPSLPPPTLRKLLPAVRDLALRYSCNPRYSTAPPAQPQAVQEALRRVEATSRLIEGVSWLTPSRSHTNDDSPKAGLAGGAAPRGVAAAPALHRTLSAVLAGAASSASAAGGGASGGKGGRGLPWLWHNPPPVLDAEWVAGLTGGGGPSSGAGALDVPAWQLQAQALHEFRAHKERLRLSVADEERQVVLTAGRGQVGGRECEAIRSWSLGEGDPGAQYALHDSAAVVSMCLVGGARAGASSDCHVASCDAAGTLHVWRLGSGEPRYLLGESLSHGALAPKRGRKLKPAGWLLFPDGSAPLPKAPAQGQHPLPPTGVNPHEHHSRDPSLPQPPPTAAPPLPGGGYTCVAAGDDVGGGTPLVAGTAGGCLAVVDVERGEIGGAWECSPRAQGGSAEVAISALCCASPSPSWYAAGTRGGWLSVLDARSGEVVWWFRRHEGRVTTLGAFRGHCLVSGAKDGTVKLWDLRMGGGSQAAGSSPDPPQMYRGGMGAAPAPLASPLASGPGIPLCTGAFRLAGEGGGGPGSAGGVGGLALFGQQACICYAGTKIGLVDLSAGRGSSTMGVTQLAGVGAGQLGAAIAGLSIMPLSRLLVVGTEDGWVRVCR